MKIDQEISNRFVRTLDGMVLIGALATIPLTVFGQENQPPAWVQTADWGIWTLFLLEYIVVVGIASKRFAFVRQNPLKLAVVVLSYPHLPTLFGLVRLARLARLFRLLRLVSVTARAVEALRNVFWRRSVVCVAAISTFIILAGGAGLTLLEPQTVRGGFADGVWWAIVTASTVGYGDIAPSTFWGRLIAILLMFSGVGLVSTLAASITSYFLGQEENATLAELKERTIRIENLLRILLNDAPYRGGAADVGADSPQTTQAAARGAQE